MRLFVSSTTKGLGSFRDRAAEVLHSLGADPEIQPYFGADSRELPNLLEDKIRACDAVICLIGPYLGETPPDRSDRSYTQFEYDEACSQGKPVYLLFAAADCTLDPIEPAKAESDGARDLQTQFREEISRRDKRIRYEFHSRENFDSLIKDVYINAVGLAAQNRFKKLPLPLVELQVCAPGKEDDRDHLDRLATQTLRFLALLTLQDALVSGEEARFGRCGMAELTMFQPGDELPLAADWLSLLEAATRPLTNSRAVRFIPDLVGWTEGQRGSLDCLVEISEKLSDKRRRVRPQELGRPLREALANLLSNLSFLESYVLWVAGETAPNSSVRQSGWAMCGTRPGLVQLPFAPTSLSDWRAGGVYFLNLKLRQSILLSPAISAQFGVTGPELLGWRCVRSEGGQAILEREPFREGDVKDSPLGPWEPGLGLTAEIPHSFPLLDDASWHALRKRFLDPELSQVLGGCFLRWGNPVHEGRHAWLYRAQRAEPLVEEQSAPTDAAAKARRYVVHQLTDEAIRTAELREWFERRCAGWQAIAHPCVLRPDPKSDAGRHAELPFLATRRITDGADLEKVRQRKKFSDDEVATILTLAVEVCEAAHAQNLRILAFPLRHFLLDATGRYWLTGFDCLTSAAPPQGFADLLGRCSRDAKDIAPEVKSGARWLPETVDVYALGRLAAELRGLDAGARSYLPRDEWKDPWKCLVFHGLAASLHLRFLSPRHFLTALNERVLSPDAARMPPLLSKDEELPVVARKSTEERRRRVRLGKYPVTNSEYYRVLVNDRGHYPYHWHDLDKPENLMGRRLAGPWCPVVFVHLEDAEHFCFRLGQEFPASVYRVPSESDWRLAAGPGRYPWGDDPPDPLRANYGRLWRGTTVVGGFPAGDSPLGYADLAGNVWEWCVDREFDGTAKRVLKGGAYDYSSGALSVAGRSLAVAWCQSPHVGFRVLCEEL